MGEGLADVISSPEITNKRTPIKRPYNIHGHNLEEVESAKYLGVNIQQNP